MPCKQSAVYDLRSKPGSELLAYWPIFLLAVTFLACAPLEFCAGREPAVSLHGKASTAYNVALDEYRARPGGVVSEVWAKGDFVRHETKAGSDLTISIQHGDLIHSFSVDDAFGMMVRASGGLGTMALIRQIEEITANGRIIDIESAVFNQVQVFDAEPYDVYEYTDRLTGEQVQVALSREDLIPIIWVGLLPTGNLTVSNYWDMEADIPIPDYLFDIPEGVDLSATSICAFAQQNEEGASVVQICSAAIQGDIEAQSQLGYLYAQVATDSRGYKAAAWWYRKAAVQGHDLSQHNIGFLYLQGLGVDQNYEKAIYWFRQAADQGYAPSAHNLGKIYLDGSGVKVNYELANDWLKRAAQNGYAAAQFYLGRNYLEGTGLERNPTEAYAWLATAEAQGMDLGKLSLSHILAGMAADQKQRAEALASDYIQKYSLK